MCNPTPNYGNMADSRIQGVIGSSATTEMWWLVTCETVVMIVTNFRALLNAHTFWKETHNAIVQRMFTVEQTAAL